MKTIAFVDTRVVGLAALEAAKRKGHRAIFFRSSRFASMYGSELARQRMSFADVIVDIENSEDVEDLYAAVMRQHESTPIDAILTTFEIAVPSVAEVAARMSLPSSD